MVPADSREEKFCDDFAFALLGLSRRDAEAATWT
jgi:hypothetical protein